MTDADGGIELQDTTLMIQIEPGSPSLAQHSEGSDNSGPVKDRIVSDGGRAEAASRTRDIYWSIWEDKQEAVNDWLKDSKNKSQVVRRDSHGYAPVHYAAKFNRPEIMRMLVEGGADIKAKTVSEEYTPLHLAACYLRHACKPCKSTKLAETIDQPDTADHAQEEGERMRSRIESDFGTLQLPKHKKDQRRSSAPLLERQTSCKEIFEFLVADCKLEIDVNAKDQYGFTPLHIACQSGNKEAVELLVGREDIDLTIPDGNGDTPLHEACFHGHEKIVKFLLDKMEEKEKSDTTKEKGAFIKNHAGLTAFHIACREDHYNIIKQLLDKYESLLKERDNEKATALHYVCRHDNVETVKLFMRRSSESNSYLTPKSDGVTPMHVAAQYGCIKVMKEFLGDAQLQIDKKIIDVRDTYDQTPLHYATEYGKTEMMKLLLTRGADKEAEDVHSYTPLLTAAEFGRVEGFQLLLDEGALLINSPSEDTSTCTIVKNKDRKTALFLAAEYNHPEIMEIILAKSEIEGRQLYKTTDTSFNSPLHIAAQNGHLEPIRMLWNNRSLLDLKLHAKNALLKTAMHLAAENGHNHIVTELQHYWKESDHQVRDVGRLLKSVDDDGNTPLHLACKHGFVDVAKTLIKMPGADIGARNKVLWTPLDCAAASGHARVIKELATAKAELDPKDKLKTTPLHLAAKEGHLTAVETLIKHGANVGLRDQRGFNALDWAIEKGHEDVAEAIITSPKWKLALRNCTDTQDGGETTPFRKLIQRMPDVAQLVLKKCTSTNAKDGGISPDCEDYAVTFSYEFIEDSHEAKEWKAKKAEKMESDKEKPVEKSSKELRKNQALKHPLKIMVESERTELLKHPLVYSLIDHKWRYEMVMVFFYISLCCYLVFAILLTTFALQLPNPLSPTCYFFRRQKDPGPMNVFQLPSPARGKVKSYLIDQNITIGTDGIANISGLRQRLCSQNSSSMFINESLAEPVSQFICGFRCPGVQNWFLKAAPWIILICCLIRVSRKLSKIRFLRKFNYRHLGIYSDNIDLATLVKFPLITCTLIFSLTFIVSWLRNDCLCPCEWQWQIGIVAVFLAWADVVLYMRKLRFLDTGLYVLMFQTIFKTFLRVMILTILLILMFALAFHMTFNHFHTLFERSPFTNMLDSVWKTMTMTDGELGYEDIFHLSTGGSSSNVPPIPFPEISYILWVIFLILMPILFTNLLVGLAVDDIKGIQEAATLTRLAMRVELILALDETLFPFVQKLIFKLSNFPRVRNCQRLHDHRELTIYPNKLSLYYSFLPKFLIGENYSSAEHLSLELNPTKTPTDQQAQNLMWEMSKIQEMLLSMNEELKGLREVKEQVLKLREEKVSSQRPLYILQTDV